MSENPSSLTRRHVVRTAATTAWAAPVIVAASAAPAYAGSPGAAVLRAPDPSFIHLNDATTIISSYQNFGTAAATSMTVTVTITPSLGTLVDADPTEVREGYSFVNRTNGPNGSQVLNFSKNPPQIAPGPSTLDGRLQFKIRHLPEPLSGIRNSHVSIVPSVPPPSTATATQGTYTNNQASADPR